MNEEKRKAAVEEERERREREREEREKKGARGLDHQRLVWTSPVLSLVI